MLKFTQRPKTPRMTSQKTLLSLKGINCLQVIFVLIWIKQSLIWFNLQRDGTENGLSNIKDIFSESLQLQMSVLHQNMCIFKGGLSSWNMAGQNIKKKYLICHISIKMLKHAIWNSSLQNLKIYSSKGSRKTSQRWINVTHSNSKSSNFQQKISLQIMSFCFEWWTLLLLTLTSITQGVT